MRWSDLLDASLSSLRQRAGRTILTVIGVLIGTMSVVLMVSLGIGMTSSVVDSMDSTSLTRIMVYDNSGISYGEGDQEQAADAKVLNDATLAELAQRPGIVSVTPVLRVPVQIRVAGSEGYLSLTGMPYDGLEREEFDLARGRLPMPAEGLAGLAGDKVQWTLDPAPGSDEAPEIDWDRDQLFATLEGQAADAAASTPPPTKRVIVPITGVLAGDPQSWDEYDMDVVVDLDALVATLEKAFPGQALPGQPATADGKPKGASLVYSEMRITAESAELAEQLTAELRDEGYDASSNIELIREMQSYALIIQAVFGGIGLVALLVAAIGIANTMMMSVYERTKQIGVMKVLGASLRDIRRMFLTESAAIGLIGGVSGLVLSLLISAAINATLGASAGMDGGPATISQIPVWLMIASVAFATLVGTVAGFIPAQRAMRLSPLAAIRSA
ncbi:MAG: ABC transporter permease [Propioniciclava sp.]